MADYPYKAACRVAAAHFGAGERLPKSVLKEVQEILERHGSKKLIPKVGESVVLTVDTPKTAALAFDKVLRLPAPVTDIPAEVGYYCATLSELVVQAGAMIQYACEEQGIAIVSKDVPAHVGDENESSWLKHISSEQFAKSKISPTVFYPSRVSQANDTKPGSREVLVAALNKLEVVDEEHLSWGQVLEFRSDKEAKLKYRRLIRWLDFQLREGSPREVIDIIACRLDDYEWALKKHGIKTMSGSVASLLDPKFLTAASASTGGAILAFGAVWGGLAAAGIALAKVGAEFAQLSVDGEQERRSANYEVAYVHEIKKKLN